MDLYRKQQKACNCYYCGNNYVKMLPIVVFPGEEEMFEKVVELYNKERNSKAREEPPKSEIINPVVPF